MIELEDLGDYIGYAIEVIKDGERFIGGLKYIDATHLVLDVKGGNLSIDLDGVVVNRYGGNGYGGC